MQIVAASIITMLSSAGIGFYFRFIAALLQDSARQTGSQARFFWWKRRAQPVCWKIHQSHAVVAVTQLQPNASSNAPELTPTSHVCEAFK